MKPLFATMKKLPRQRTLTEEGNAAYSNPRNTAQTMASFRSNNRSLVLTFTTSFTINHLLSVKPEASPPELTSGFALKSAPPRKLVLPVYTEARRG